MENNGNSTKNEISYTNLNITYFNILLKKSNQMKPIF